jgi:Ribonuclease G/E
MEKQTLEILQYEDKTSKAGKQYTRFKTNSGWMSAFDSDVIKPLKDLVGKKAVCMVAVDEEKGFSNIRSFIEEADKLNVEVVKVGAVEEQPKPKNSQATMWASYAKDIFVQLLANKAGQEVDITQLKKVSIEAVEEFKRAFE